MDMRDSILSKQHRRERRRHPYPLTHPVTLAKFAAPFSIDPAAHAHVGSHPRPGSPQLSSCSSSPSTRYAPDLAAYAYELRGRRPSLCSEFSQSSTGTGPETHYFESDILPSPTATTDSHSASSSSHSSDTSSQRAASWVSQFSSSLRMSANSSPASVSINGSKQGQGSPLASPISSAGSGPNPCSSFPGPVEASSVHSAASNASLSTIVLPAQDSLTRRQDSGATLKDKECMPLYSEEAKQSSKASPPARVLGKAKSCAAMAMGGKRLWELPLRLTK